MARDLTAYALQSTLMTIAPGGGTLGLLVNPLNGEITSLLKYFTGGSLEIFQAPLGTTAPAAGYSLVPGTGYLLGTSESLTFDGAVRYYLVATGATAQAYSLKGLSQGY